MASKILRSANAPKTSPDAIEMLVGQALIDLENNVADLKAELRPLQISAAREVDVKVRWWEFINGQLWNGYILGQILEWIGGNS